MGGCLSSKFKKHNKVSPSLASTTEFDDELIQRAKRYLRDQYQSSLQTSYAQTGPSLMNLRKNTLKLGVWADKIAPGVKILSVEAAARERAEASLASEDSMKKCRNTFYENEENSSDDEGRADDQQDEDETSDSSSSMSDSTSDSTSDESEEDED